MHSNSEKIAVGSTKTVSSNSSH